MIQDGVVDNVRDFLKGVYICIHSVHSNGSTHRTKMVSISQFARQISSHAMIPQKLKLAVRCSQMRHEFPFASLNIGSPVCLHLPQLPVYPITTKMCFGDDGYRDSYETRVEIRNDRRYYTQEYCPGYGMSRRRKYGFGGSYYPSRYYARPPTGHCMSNAYIRPRQYIQSGRYPRGVVPGGYSRGVVQGRRGLFWTLVWLCMRHWISCWGSAGYAGQFHDGMFPLFSPFSERAALCLPFTTPPPYPTIIGSHAILNIACISVSIAATTSSLLPGRVAH
jgi:hypothetical protein